MNYIDILLGHSLWFGLILSLVLGILIWGSIYINPEIWLNDYPPDIRAKYGPASEKAKKQKKILVAIFFPTFLAVLFVSMFQIPGVTGNRLAFLPVFLNLFVILMVLNLIDLLIFDWLIGIVIRPRFMILPGTEGMAGYQDYGFHLRGFLIGIPGFGILSLVLAGIVMAVASIF
jgi:hypothetical protein